MEAATLSFLLMGALDLTNLTHGKFLITAEDAIDESAKNRVSMRTFIVKDINVTYFTQIKSMIENLLSGIYTMFVTDGAEISTHIVTKFIHVAVNLLLSKDLVKWYNNVLSSLHTRRSSDLSSV